MGLWPFFDQKIRLNIAFDLIMKHMKLLLFTNAKRDKKKLRKRERESEKDVAYLKRILYMEYLCKRQ